MTEFLLLLLLAAAYALGRARDERDRLLRLLVERRAGRPVQRQHWQPDAAQFEAERQVWQQAAAFERAARQAMHRVVDDPPRTATAPTGPPSRPVRRSSPGRARPETASPGVTADEVARLTVRRSR